jgi:hypothetical protein
VERVTRIDSHDQLGRIPRAHPSRLGCARRFDLLAPRGTVIGSGLGPAKGPARLLFDLLHAVATSSSRRTSDGRRWLGSERRSCQDRPVAVADLHRNCYSVRYSHLARPHHSVRVSLVSARRIRRRSGLLGARVDRFRVRAEPLPGNAGECGVCSVCKVAFVCQCAGWLADSLADSE